MERLQQDFSSQQKKECLYYFLFQAKKYQDFTVAMKKIVNVALNLTKIFCPNLSSI